MKKIWLLFFALIHFSCESKQKEPIGSTPLNPCYGMVNLENWKDEILDIDSILINGKLPFTSKIDTYHNFFGKPDFKASIPATEGFLNFINPDSLEYGERYYFGQSNFDAVGGIAVIHKLQFNDRVKFLSHPVITLTKDTNIRDLMKLFPESCKLIANPGNGYVGVIILRASRFDLDPRRVVLAFNSEWLDYIEICTFR